MTNPKRSSARSDAERRLRQSLRFGRILRLLHLIQGHRHWSSRDIARELECSERTVRRDLQVLELAGVPWYFDDQQECYRVRPGWAIPTASFTADELIDQATSFVVTSAPGLCVGRHLDQVRLKFIGHLGNDGQRLMNDVEGLLAVLNLGLVDHCQHQEQLVTVRRALLQRRQIVGRYESPYQTQPARLTLHPIRLCLIRQAWYVVALPEGEAAPKTYRVARFHSLGATERPALIPEEFDLQSYLGNAWGVYRGTPTVRVKLRFTPAVSRLVTETKWHATQEEQRLRNGSVTLGFTVDGLDEILWWILGWSGRVTVLEPAELRERVMDQLHRGIELHRKRTA